ncbi:hypothetical protein ACU635_07985 [[Actinomadura] parvosata]
MVVGLTLFGVASPAGTLATTLASFSRRPLEASADGATWRRHHKVTP